ncbi:MAG TPA: hypothetical protein G4N96_02195 [Chloroflexi bacterium]|nr:hypothetical protein [Chloroflexota bacterium]
MVSTIQLQLEIPANRVLNISLPPDIPRGLAELVLVISPVKTGNQAGIIEQSRKAARDLLLTMPEKAASPVPNQPKDLAANHDFYLYGE